MQRRDHRRSAARAHRDRRFRPVAPGARHRACRCVQDGLVHRVACSARFLVGRDKTPCRSPGIVSHRLRRFHVPPDAPDALMEGLRQELTARLRGRAGRHRSAAPRAVPPARSRRSSWPDRLGRRLRPAPRELRLRGNAQHVSRPVALEASATSAATPSRSAGGEASMNGASGPPVSVIMRQNSAPSCASCESTTRSWPTAWKPAPTSARASAPSVERWNTPGTSGSCAGTGRTRAIASWGTVNHGFASEGAQAVTAMRPPGTRQPRRRSSTAARPPGR